MNRPPDEPPADSDHYEIRVAGQLDSSWTSWFDDLEVHSDVPGQTVLTGPIADQAALHGVLTRISDLGLPLISLRRVDPG